MKFLDELEVVIKRDNRFVAEDGRILKPKVDDACMKCDAGLLSLLLSNDIMKDHFFTHVDGMYVFNQNKFSWVINSREFLPDSYTAFKNMIGLSDRTGQFISYKRDIALVWPFKDCVLEGGQTKEDQKRNEIFYNETLAPDEVSRVLHPKVFTNAKRFTKDNEVCISSISEKDNLVIKGNNLIVIASLLKRYEEKIKLIYIDPPYNTGNDGFNYNDTFNHSSWLTFMKNRLEIARKLLMQDGSIAISIDNNEIGYLLLLLDEIFGRENRKHIITVKRGSVTGAKVVNPGVVNVVEYVVIYAKSSVSWSPNRVYSAKEYDERYNVFIDNFDEGYEQWKFSTVLERFAEKHSVKKTKLRQKLGSEYQDELEKFIIENSYRIVQFASLDENSISQTAVEIKKHSQGNPNQIFYLDRENGKPYYLKNGKIILFASDRIIEIDGKKTFCQPISDIWDDVLPNDLHNEGGVEFRKGKKPEKLISRIIDLCSDKDEIKGDIVLDFFAGSGTLGAVALKTGRQFILCEQMDYIDEKIIPRLQNVINGENRGVSQDWSWSGGGSFVYFELIERSEAIIHALQETKTKDEVLDLLKNLLDNGCLKPTVIPEELKACWDKMSSMTIDTIKRLFLDLIDKNKLYVNLCDIDDEEMNVKPEDKIFTKNFYRIDKESTSK